MYKINFEKPVHVHFIGIGGISMSGLAEILLKEGFIISGSDNKESALTDHLEKLGAKVFYGQKASNIISGIDVVVYTAAIHPDNEEFAEAVKQNLPMLTRAELLGQLMTNYDVPIAIPVPTARQRQLLCCHTFYLPEKWILPSLSAAS